MSRTGPRVLVLSPHFDDVPLSLGQSLLDGALRRCPVHVHVVFGRSNWTRWVHPTEGRAGPVSAWRRAEESLASLLFRYRWDAAGFREALLRGVPGDELLDPRRSVADGPLLDELRHHVRGVLARRSADLVVLPAGIGGHVDHQLLARIGTELAAEGTTVAFFEDRPYAAWATEEERRADLDGLGPLDPVTVSGPVTDGLHRCLRWCYPSQIDDNFREAMAADRAARPVERLWFPEGAARPPVGGPRRPAG